VKEKIIEYIRKQNHRLVSPIWGGEKAFPFLCLGHLEISKALGFELEQATPVLTIVKAGQLTSEEELDILIQKRQFNYNYFNSEVEYLLQMKKENSECLCGGGCFGPLTVVSGILGAENMLRFLVKKPQLVERFVGYVTEFLIELAKKETEAGEDFFWIAEPLASVLSPKNFWKFSGQYLKKIYEASDVPGFLHVCGKTIKHTKYMEETGAQVLSIDSCTDMGECIKMVDKDVVIMGNVSPNNLRLGTKEEVENEVREILKACEGHDNFIMSTGCSIMEGTPDENMQVLFDLCK
jgi:MtaA/CmuA family methyltransferase